MNSLEINLQYDVGQSECHQIYHINTIILVDHTSPVHKSALQVSLTKLTAYKIILLMVKKVLF